MCMHRISDYLNVLPTELVEKILDHTSIVDILSSSCLVNRRLYSFSLAYSRIPLDFSRIARKKKQSRTFIPTVGNGDVYGRKRLYLPAFKLSKINKSK